MNFAKIIAWVGLLSMAAVLIYGFTTGNFGEDGLEFGQQISKNAQRRAPNQNFFQSPWLRYRAMRVYSAPVKNPNTIIRTTHIAATPVDFSR